MDMKKKCRIWLVVGIVLLVGVLLYLVLRLGAVDNQKDVRVVLGCEMSLLTAPVWIALDKGYFAANGVELDLREYESGKKSLESMLKVQQLDICTVAQTPVMFNSFTNDDFAIISTMVSSYTDMKVITDSHAVAGAHALSGKKVGVTKGSTGEYFLSLVLKRYGVDPAGVKVVDYGPDKLSQALASADVSAIATWEPHAQNATRALGAGAGIIDTSTLYREDFYFVARKKWLDKSRPAAERFLRAMSEAMVFMEEHPEEARAIVAKRLQLSKEFVDSLWHEFDYKLFLDQRVYQTLEEEAVWAIKNQIVPSEKIPNFLHFIRAEPLREVDAPAVQIISPEVPK